MRRDGKTWRAGRRIDILFVFITLQYMYEYVLRTSASAYLLLVASYVGTS